MLNGLEPIVRMNCLDKLSHPVSDDSHHSVSRSYSLGSWLCLFVSADVFDLSLSDCCLQENEDTTENGINPELAKVRLHFETMLRTQTSIIIVSGGIQLCLHNWMLKMIDRHKHPLVLTLGKCNASAECKWESDSASQSKHGRRHCCLSPESAL